MVPNLLPSLITACNCSTDKKKQNTGAFANHQFVLTILITDTESTQRTQQIKCDLFSSVS